MWPKRWLVLALSVALVSCGTIMHPDRKGQRGGNLDIGIVLLDGIGLFFFIIPGIIAYAVDFSNGTIYLPGWSLHGANARSRGLKMVSFDPKHYTPQSLAELIRANTGYEVDWRDPRLQAVKLHDTDEAFARFERHAGLSAPGAALASSR
jgi:hypothetical protein